MKSQTVTIKQEGFKDLSDADSKHKFICGLDMSDGDEDYRVSLQILRATGSISKKLDRLDINQSNMSDVLDKICNTQEKQKDTILDLDRRIFKLEEDSKLCDIKDVKTTINELNLFKSNHEQQEKDKDKIFKIAGFSIQQFFVVISLVIGFIGLLIAFFKK